jgi:tRNA-specific 2-thiouridylase
VSPFVSAYAAGLTPNPCSRCNGSFRFDALLGFAERTGAAVLWTGHYARVAERDGRRLVARAADPDKDQSYMLALVDPHLLERIAFPLGNQDKAATRAEAEAAGLAVAARPESQEACFLAGGDYRAFLERHGVTSQPGPIVDEDGAELGRHDGSWRFTPGQRRGVGVSAPEPLYAIRTDRATNTVVVGPRSSLATTEVQVDGTLHVPADHVVAKLRYRSDPVRARVRPTATGFELTLDEPAQAVAPGQVAVLYDRDGAVVGAGIITASGR